MESNQSKNTKLMEIIDSLGNRKMEDFSAKPFQFDESKVRDEGYKRQLNQILTQIKELFNFDSYLAFRKNKGLYNRFINVYEANLEDYEAKYLETVQHYDQFKQKLKTHRAKVHPAHFGQIDLSQIERLLEVHDYNENQSAQALIAELSKRLDDHAAQFKAWQDQVMEFQVQINKHRSVVWLEVAEQWQRRLDEYKKELLGHQIPTAPIVLSNSEIDKAKARRKSDVERWIQKLDIDSKFIDESRQYFEGKAKEADFKAFCDTVNARLLKAQKRNRRLWIIYLTSISSVILLTLVFFFLIKPKIDEENYWESTLENATRSDFERYLYRYPRGEHVGEANEQLKLIEDALWRDAYQTRTVESYELYIEEYPRGRYRQEALRQQQEVLDQQEKDLWLVSKKENSIASYQVYIDTYPDGKYLIEAIELQFSLFLVHTFTIQTLTGELSGVTSVAYSSDGDFLLSGAWDNGVRKWSVESGESIGSLYGHSEDVTCIAISPDSKYAVSGSSDHTIKYWDLKYGKQLKSFEGHEDGITSVCFSPNGQNILSSGLDQKIIQWEISSGQATKTYTKHKYNTGEIACSGNGDYLVFSGWNEVRLVELSTMRHKIYREGEGTGYDQFIFSVDISHDNSVILSSGTDKQMVLWDAHTGKILRKFPKQSDRIFSVAISDDGKFALSGLGDGQLKLWNLTSGKSIRKFDAHEKVVTSVAFSPDGKFAISGSTDGTMKLWNLGL